MHSECLHIGLDEMGCSYLEAASARSEPELYVWRTQSTSYSNFCQVLPLMNIIFGHLAQNFNLYFIPNSTMEESRFKSIVNKYSSVPLKAYPVYYGLTPAGCTSFCSSSAGSS